MSSQQCLFRALPDSQYCYEHLPRAEQIRTSIMNGDLITLRHVLPLMSQMEKESIVTFVIFDLKYEEPQRELQMAEVLRLILPSSGIRESHWLLGAVKRGLLKLAMVLGEHVYITPVLLSQVIGMPQYDTRSLLELLLRRGAQAYIHQALLVSRRSDITEFLLEHKADPNTQDTRGSTLLMELIKLSRRGYEHIQQFQMLLRHGANPNMKDQDGNTAVILAAQQDLLTTVNFLRERGADLRLRNKQGQNAYDIIRERDASPNLTRLLEGPYRVERYRFPGNEEDPAKIIHLFYDIHRYMKPCQNSTHIITLLDRMLRHSSQVVDFILETPPELSFVWYEKMVPTSSIHYLFQMGTAFKDCFNRAKRNPHTCPYPQVRFHFNDWRQHQGSFLSRMILYHIDRDLAGARALAESVFGSLEGLRDVAHWDRILRHDMRVDKQLNQCAPRVRNIINRWLEKRVDLNPAWSDLVISWLKGGPDAIHHLYVLGGNYMDAYTMARMFRRFQQIPGRYSEPMRNIIIYAGGIHCSNYAVLLQEIGAYKDGESIKSSSCQPEHQLSIRKQEVCQCQDVSTLVPWAGL